MLRLLPAPLRGAITFVLLAVNTTFWLFPLLILSFLKMLLPFPPVQRGTRYLMHGVAQTWVAGNKAWMNSVGRTQWDVQGLEKVDMQSTYLVTSNHQSWVDIFALQFQLNRHMPMLKFFLKKELIWVPVAGLCWWALEFPFMKRYSKEYLLKHPEKKGQDLITTRIACERYKTNPVSVFNFLEGTRFTKAKHDAQKSPFQYLLKPKAGGIAFVIDAMGEQLQSMVNITIHYPEGKPEFLDLLCGRVGKIVMRIEQIKIPAEFIGKNYDQDEVYRAEFQQWINKLWEDKDALLGRLHQDFS